MSWLLYSTNFAATVISTVQQSVTKQKPPTKRDLTGELAGVFTVAR